jgi:hypothetical protein
MKWCAVFFALSTGAATAGKVDPGEAAILDEKTAPEEAAKLAREGAKLDRRAKHARAVAANTRGLRLFKAGQCDPALPLFEAAASLEKNYGMPRFNAARCHAQKGEAAECVRLLAELHAIGPKQLERFAMAEHDEGFARVAADPAFKQLFANLTPGERGELEALAMFSPDRPLPGGLWKPLLKKGTRWTLPRVGDGEGAKKLTVRVVEAKKEGAADLIRLQYDRDDDKDVTCGALPKRFAITASGVYPFGDDATHDDIVTLLKKRPALAEPPRGIRANTRDDGLFLFAPLGRDDLACYGFGAGKPDEDGVGCGAAPCCSWICLDGKGVVAAGGTDDSNSGFGIAASISCD